MKSSTKLLFYQDSKTAHHSSIVKSRLIWGPSLRLTREQIEKCLYKKFRNPFFDESEKLTGWCSQVALFVRREGLLMTHRLAYLCHQCLLV